MIHYRTLFNDLWPNCVAVSVWTISLFVWHHRSMKKQLTAVRAHITAEHEKTRRHHSGA